MTVHETLFKKLVQNAEATTLSSTFSSLLCDLAMPYNHQLLEHSKECCKVFLETIKKYRPEFESELQSAVLRFKEVLES